MKEQSIWSEVTLKSFPSLESDVETHVLIVGGGIAGLLTAYQLQENNIPYILVEQDKIGNGISKNTTSFLTISHDYLYQDMIKDLGILKASVYLNLNAKAIEEYKKLSFKYDFDFYEDSPLELYTNLEFFLYVDHISPRKRKELEREIKKKMDKYKTRLSLEQLNLVQSRFQMNSYDLLFEEHLQEYSSLLEQEVFQLEYQIQGKRRTLLDIFLSNSKLQKLVDYKSTSLENKEKAQAKIKILNQVIEHSDFSLHEVGDVIKFLFTSGLLDQEKKVDESLFDILMLKYQHMISIGWYRFSDEYVNYLNLVKEIESKLMMQMKKNKQLSLKTYQRYVENEQQFKEHIIYFEKFKNEMNQFFEELQQVISM